MKKVLFFLPGGLWQTHLISMLEIILDYKQKGYKIYLIQCDEEYKSGCIYCPQFKCNTSDCTFCKKIIQNGLKLINLENFKKLKMKKKDYNLNIPKFKSLNELKNYKIENFDIGLAVMSNIFFKTKNTCFSLKDNKNKKYIKELILLSYQVYKSIIEYIQIYNFDEIYVFNGRFDILRAVLRAAQKLNCTVKVIEAAGVMNKYTVTNDTYPHNLEYQQKLLNKLWEKEKSYEKKEKMAKKWFLERKKGQDQGDISYIKHQIKNLLPSNFNNKKRNITIFISSEHEISTIPGYENNLFKNQLEAIKFIINNFQNKNNYHFYIRVHPNLKNSKDCTLQKLKKTVQKINNFSIIEAESAVDSYYLLEKSEKIITFGSTIGIEAIFYKKPSILIGKTIYADDVSLYIPKTRQEAIQYIEKKLEPLNPIMAIKYGYYQMTRGIPYKYYVPEHPYYGKFFGKRITKL